MAAASASTVRQPIHGSVGSMPLHWSHFPTCFPSTEIWLRPCWDPWPSFPHDQDVSSCCIQCLGLPRALQFPPILLTPLYNPPALPGKWVLSPISAPDLHRPPSKNPGALGKNTHYRAIHSFTVATHPSTSLLASLGLHTSQDRELPPFSGSKLVFRQCPLGEVLPCTELEPPFPEAYTTQPFLPTLSERPSSLCSHPSLQLFQWRVPD